MQATGLTETQAREQLAREGPNELPVSRPRSVLRLLADIAREPMFLLLVACGAIYLVLGNRNDALMLLGFVFVVMGITFVQQRRTERSLEALRDMSSPQALVLREGKTRKVPGRELVCGDIVLLAEGDRVPADMDLLAAANLTVDESMLSGESVPVSKQLTAATDTSAAASPAPVDDKHDEQEAGSDNTDRVFSGTLVTQGTAQGRVVATGERSALGRIGKSLEGLGGEDTPIQNETRKVVKRVAIIGLLLAAGLALAYGVSTGDWLHGLLAGLTLAMAILPEELPVVLTLFLGLGAWRLAREQVLARSIPAVELLGATTVLCVDKTGTLTANRMAVRRLWTPAASYDSAQAADKPLGEDLHEVLEFAVLASHRRAFDPMEAAIGAAGQRLLANTEHLHADWTLVDDYPLSPEMLAMSRVWQSPDLQARMIAAKGAPEAIVDLCHMDATRHAAVATQVALMASAGLRVLGVARASLAAAELPAEQHDFDFEFLGLIALEDPVRPEVPQAIAECKAAGIRVVMITGDHPATASSIARQAGLNTESGPPITGTELATLSEAELDRRLADTHIFCRVQPEQKLRLVQAFRARGEVVAMTGDGVNDAPALKAAHIGVAMGARGTDVAREAAALVLLNDDFTALVTAVRYGRRVFANLRKAIVFVIAVHVPIVGLSILPVLLGWPMLLMPVHILFLQLIIDPACSVVFEAEPLEPDAMRQPPRRPDARLFDRAVLVRGLWQGAGLLALLLGVFALTRAFSGSDEVARALTFSVLVLSNLGLIYANRSWNRPALLVGDTGAPEVPGVPGTSPKLGGLNPTFLWMALATLSLLAIVLAVPAVRALFSFAQPSPQLLLAGCGAALLSLVWFEAVKWGLRPRAGTAA
ncbi:cation-translocating P-type ATPase [Paucibacter sp. KCTC 42545]|uniref:cation-translocating P-type ATPase n=1 Tax=Paucibacter sp. KCTC 42545 TaxID=1768242 RepID=UPI000733BCB2|nr:cation-translocating P-type ATPase [Paucibacter sp. KCTC 42545]ALT78517.1 ATPase [Paucibacter sp. KCTC 42545]